MSDQLDHRKAALADRYAIERELDGRSGRGMPLISSYHTSHDRAYLH